MKLPLSLTLLALAGHALAQADETRWTLDLETGLTGTRYNYAQVPKATGTEISLANLLGRGWQGYGRVALAYTDDADGTWKLLYAPFRQSGDGTLPGPTQFGGQSFAAGPVRAGYQFDSYRLTYRKPWRGGWSVGGTLKVRDAEIRLEQGGAVRAERNTGFVPLLHVHGEGVLAPGWRYEIEMDGLAGGPGRAIDLSLRAKRPLSDRAEAFVGFRVLEGGADVPRVRNFAWVNYVTAGVAIRF